MSGWLRPPEWVGGHLLHKEAASVREPLSSEANYTVSAVCYDAPVQHIPRDVIV